MSGVKKGALAHINLKSLFMISILIFLYLIAFFWGGYYISTSIIYFAVFLGILIISACIGSYYYTTKSLRYLIVVTFLITLIGEYVHMSVGRISFFDQAVPSLIKILSWSILIIPVVWLAQALETRVGEKDYPWFIRILPTVLCLSPLFAVMMAQKGVYTFNLVIIILYIVLFALSFLYTSVHTLQSNNMSMISSLVFGFIIEYLGSLLGLWTFGFNEPISLLILFSWPVITWVIYLFCGLASFDFGTVVYDPKTFDDEQIYEQICADNSIIVIADTHFGLNTDNEACDPNAFADFLKWIKQLETKKQFLDVGDWAPEYSGKNLELKPPAKIILLGDILELWTASNESILASTIYIIQLLSELNCEKIYLLGNHDIDLMSIKGRYPLGASDIKIKDVDEYWIKGEKENFCFLHGQQFDEGFSFPSWKLVGLLRKAALAFGNYTLFFAIPLLINIGLWILGIGGISNIMLMVLLAFILAPFLFIKVARPTFNRLKTIKFKPEAALESANKVLDRIYDPEGKFLNVVYGHTHTIDYRIIQEKREEDLWEDLMRIMNLPSWVSDVEREPRKESLARKKLEHFISFCRSLLERWHILKSSSETKKEISNVFLYLSADCPPTFIGWDSKKKQGKKLYYIPSNVIYNKREFGNLFNPNGVWSPSIPVNHTNVSQKLADINWPEKLINKWING